MTEKEKRQIDILMDFLPHVTKLYKELAEEDKDIRDLVLMTIAADALHDVSDENRKEFFEKYEDIRKGIADLL